MGLRYCAQSASECRHPASAGEFGKVKRDGFNGCWERFPALPSGPALKVVPVGAVGTKCVLGFGLPYIILSFGEHRDQRRFSPRHNVPPDNFGWPDQPLPSASSPATACAINR